MIRISSRKVVYLGIREFELPLSSGPDAVQPILNKLISISQISPGESGSRVAISSQVDTICHRPCSRCILTGLPPLFSAWHVTSLKSSTRHHGTLIPLPIFLRYLQSSSLSAMFGDAYINDIIQSRLSPLITAILMHCMSPSRTLIFTWL